MARVRKKKSKTAIGEYADKAKSGGRKKSDRTDDGKRRKRRSKLLSDY